MDKTMNIDLVIPIIEDMILKLRQCTDTVWEDVNTHIGVVISMMTEIVNWARNLIGQGEEFPMDTVIQQIQNLNDAYTAKDEVLLADTLEYEIKNTVYVYMENR